jgi:hypothetical protein
VFFDQLIRRRISGKSHKALNGFLAKRGQYFSIYGRGKSPGTVFFKKQAGAFRGCGENGGVRSVSIAGVSKLSASPSSHHRPANLRRSFS